MYDNVVHCQIKYIRLEAPCVRGQSLMRGDSCKGWPAMDILQNFRRNAGAPYEAARSWKQTGNKPVMAYFCSYTPEEILYAAGVFPLRIFGTSTHISHADAHLQSYSCSLVRVEDALSGQLSFLDGVVFPHTRFDPASFRYGAQCADETARILCCPWPIVIRRAPIWLTCCANSAASRSIGHNQRR